jgi:hypothetical protein
MYGLALFILGAIISAIISIFFGPLIEQLASRLLGGVLPGGDSDLRGDWRSVYHYTSQGRPEEAEQLMRLSQIGRTVYGKNIGGSSQHKHAIKVNVNGDWATGAWRNTARGARHYGVMQLRILPSGREMKGRWIGFDSNADIQEGDWAWTRVP